MKNIGHVEKPTSTTSKSSIKVALFAALGSLAALFIVTIGWQGATALRAYTAALDQRDFDASANRFIAGIYAMLLERLETNNALQAPDAASPAVLAKIDAFRKVVRDDFDVGLAGIAQREFPNKTALMNSLQAALQKANDYRRQADAALKMPRDGRDETLRKTFVPVVTDSVNAALKAWYAALYGTAKGDPQLARLASIKEIGWRMREYSGLERSSVAAGIASGGSIQPERLSANAQLRSRIAGLWEQLQNLTADADTYPAIQEAMSSAQDKYFKQFIALSDQMRQAGEAGGKYPMTAPQWVETTNPQIDSLLGIMHAAGKASETVTSAAIERSLRGLQIVCGLLVLGIAITLACMWVVASRVTRPLVQLSQVIERLAANDLTVEVPATQRRDELGVMSAAVAFFKDRMIEADHARAEQAEIEQRAAAERKAAMQRLAAQFEQAVGEVVITVSAASTELEHAAKSLTATAEVTQRVAGGVAAASEQASENVQSVATAAEEMTASVREIGRQVQDSSRIANEAVKQAGRTDTRINELSQAAGRIGDVVKLITAIAEQTNLLALNATIEAARAGEAGKGFAVVAQEVKALAAQTAKATGEISAQISGMQAATQESVAAIKEIGGTIGTIAEIATSIAAAVEEQDAAMAEIARNVQQAARGTTQVAANITEVNRGAGETGSASSQVLSSAQQLAGESNRLKREVEKFLTTVRAD